MSCPNTEGSTNSGCPRRCLRQQQQQKHTNKTKNNSNNKKARKGVPPGLICVDICTSGHTKMETTDATFYLIQALTPASTSTEAVPPGVWQRSLCVTGASHLPKYWEGEVKEWAGREGSETWLVIKDCEKLYTRAYAQTHARAHTHTRARACTHTHTHPRTNSPIHTHTNVRMRAHTHTHTWMRARTPPPPHTHIHTPPPPPTPTPHTHTHLSLIPLSVAFIVAERHKFSGNQNLLACHSHFSIKQDEIWCRLLLKQFKLNFLTLLYSDTLNQGKSLLFYLLRQILYSNKDDNLTERRNLRFFFFFFYNLLTAPRTISNTNAPVARAQSCANSVQRTERLSRATCRVPRGRKGQLSY